MADDTQPTDHDALYVALTRNAEGRETVVVRVPTNGRPIPMIFIDELGVEAMHEWLAEAAETRGRTITVVKFHRGETIRVYK